MKGARFLAVSATVFLAFFAAWWWLGLSLGVLDAPAPTAYEVQVCRGGERSPSYEVAALPGEWATADAGECGVRWREATP